MYFTLINDIHYDSDKYIKDPVGLPVDFDLMSGKRLDWIPDEPLVYSTNAKQGDELRDFLRSSFTLMTKQFYQLFLDAGVKNLQSVPAIIKSEEDGYVWDNYVGVNVIGLIACADLAKSRYSEIIPGDFYIFKELAIDATKCDGALMFRLEEHLPTIIMHKSVGRYIMEQDPDESLKGWDVGEIIQ